MQLLLALLLACSTAAPVTCDLAQTAEDLAGAGATDCGAVEIDGDATLVDGCTVDAFNAGEAFFAVYTLQGIDSAVETGLASDGTTVFYLGFDSDPSGGGRDDAAIINQSSCTNPIVQAGDAGHDVLSCEQWSESDLVCDESA